MQLGCAEVAAQGFPAPLRRWFNIDGEAINALAVRHGARRGQRGHHNGNGGEERDEATRVTMPGDGG
jgi:hypothetical protein